jgi:hypothetical protein
VQPCESKISAAKPFLPPKKVSRQDRKEKSAKNRKDLASFAAYFAPFA